MINTRNGILDGPQLINEPTGEAWVFTCATLESREIAYSVYFCPTTL